LASAEAGGDGLPERELDRIIREAACALGFELSPFELVEIKAHLERERRPFGVLQPLVDDPSVSDIIVTDFSRIAVQQGRSTVGTDLRFTSPQSYEAFVERLLHRAGSSYSTKKPIADGMIDDFARIHAVHRSLCESGPYLTIRLNRFASVKLRDLERRGFAPRTVFDYLRILVRRGRTVLIVGEVGTGKTTLTRALAASVPLDESILVIEDTPEIRLEHPHVRYVSTREANAEGAGRITPSECIRAGMRMAMNRIIFGEIRDAEAAEAFVDVCASGHPGLSTLHARSALEAISRLELFLARAQRGAQRGVLTEQIVTAVQIIAFVDVCRDTGERRIKDIREIGPVADGVVRQREIFRYEFDNGEPVWRVHSRLSAHRELLEGTTDGVVLSALPTLLRIGRSEAA
jgi:pilus assembly protein CpaF